MVYNFGTKPVVTNLYYIRPNIAGKFFTVWDLKLQKGPVIDTWMCGKHCFIHYSPQQHSYWAGMSE